MHRFFERRVHREIPASDLLINNRPQFPAPGILRKRPPLKAELGRKAHSHRPVPFLRHANSRPDMVPHPFPSRARLDAAEEIKARFTPSVPPMRDLDGFM